MHLAWSKFRNTEVQLTTLENKKRKKEKKKDNTDGCTLSTGEISYRLYVD